MSFISGILAAQLVALSLLLVATTVVSQDTSSDQDMDIYVPEVGGTKNTVLCQGKDMTLSCTNTSMVLVIIKATYGRGNNGGNICPYNPDNSKLNKKDTDDKKNGCEKVVTPKVRELCNKRKTCQISARKEVFGRPCKGIYKYLLIIYTCGMPVYVPKNVTVNVTKPNVTTSNVTQSNTTVPPTISTTSNRTMPLNSSWTTSYPSRQPVTSAVPLLPSSSTAAKTVIDDKQRSSTNNSSTYIAVFVITSVCAAIVIGGVFARCWYLRRRTKSQNFAVLHKPKRFFEPPRQFKQSNGHVTRRPSHDVNLNEDFLADRSLNNKASDLVFTKADIESTPRLKQQSQGLASKDEADAPKGDNSTFYVNPMYDKSRQNGSASGGSTPSSHPRTQGGPHRLSNASDSKAGVPESPARTLNKQQMRCHSMGNIPRSSHAGMQRRHPSAGNVASNKDMYQHSQQQSFLYNAPQIKSGNYQGQGQGQGSYQGQGQQRGPMSQSPARQVAGPHPSKNPTRPNGPQQSSPTKALQRNRPGGASYPTPGHQGRMGKRPNSPYEYGSTEKDPLMNGHRYPGSNDPNTTRYQGNTPGEIGITVNPASAQCGPKQYRSTGPMPSREGRQPYGPAGNHIQQLDDVSGHEVTKHNDNGGEADLPPPDGDTAGPLITIRMSFSKKMDQFQQALFSK